MFSSNEILHPPSVNTFLKPMLTSSIALSQKIDIMELLEADFVLPLNENIVIWVLRTHCWFVVLNLRDISPESNVQINQLAIIVSKPIHVINPQRAPHTAHKEIWQPSRRKVLVHPPVSSILFCKTFTISRTCSWTKVKRRTFNSRFQIWKRTHT